MLTLKVNPEIFNSIYIPYLYDDTRTQIFFGGASSGKSVFLAQRCLLNILAGGRNYLVVRNVGDTNRISTFNEIGKLIREWGVGNYFKINKANLEVTCKNGYQIIFKGLDNVEKIKSITPLKGVITDVWAEEATECFYDGIKQLAKRLRGKSKVKKRMMFSFNPIMKIHWLFQKYFANPRDNTLIVKTTYKDNRFLEPDDIAELENETDEYWHRVYTLGEWGTLGDTVFSNWEVKDLEAEKKHFDTYHNGLDFGYTNDPTAMIRSHYDRSAKTIYITDETYEKKLSNAMIAELIRPIIHEEYIVCDCAEPKSIDELRQYQINALPAAKGKDSIIHGIQWLQQQKIIIDKNCQNVINEFQLYQWKKDKEGNSLNEPIDRFNHTIDALRYSYEGEMRAIEGGVYEGAQSQSKGEDW